MDNLHIALIRAEEICTQEEWPMGLAVTYDPGSVSSESFETLSYCFLEQYGDGTVQVCSSDDAGLAPALAGEAIKRLDQRRREVTANLPGDWHQGIKPDMKHWAKMLFRLQYFEPGHRFAKGMLALIREGKVLSRKQIDAIKKVYKERGNVDGLRKRQHAQWRLMRLAEIDLEPGDRETVKKFAAHARATLGLRESELPVVTALEEKYYQKRLAATRKRAQRIAEGLRLSSTGPRRCADEPLLA
jgi:hypothetical protein